MEFVAELAKSLAWPIVVLVLGWMFRKSLAKLIGLPLARLSFPGGEAVWSSALTDTSAQLQDSEQETKVIQEDLSKAQAPSVPEEDSWEFSRFGFDQSLLQAAENGPPVIARASGISGLRRYANERLYKLNGKVGGTDLREIARSAQESEIIEVGLFESLLSIADLNDLLTHGSIHEDSAKVTDLLSLIRDAHRQFTVQALGFEVMGPISQREQRRANGWRTAGPREAPPSK